MKNRKAQSALLVAGAAAGVVAAAWMNKRRLRAVPPLEESTPPERSALPSVDDSDPDLVGSLLEPESAELPIGRSADPEIDESLSRRYLPQDETSGAALLGDLEPSPESDAGDASLDEVWNSMPGLVGGEQTEGYDAVQPEDLGAVWLERATQTTHDERPHLSDPNDVPNLDALVMSEASRTSARALDDIDEEDGEDEEEDEAIEDDALDLPASSRSS